MADNYGSSKDNDSIGTYITAPIEHPQIRINKWRVREGFPVTANQVILLYQIVNNESEVDKVIQKLKAVRVGTVKRCLFKEGDIVKSGESIMELSECLHNTVIKDMCADCGADLRQNEHSKTIEASVPMIHSVPDLKVTQKLAQKIGHDDTRRLLEDHKLVLLVDLDQTVIHTTNDNVPNYIKGIYHFQLYGPHSPWYHTRLRPGTKQFLENISEFYELHICTFGARNYAHMIAQLLDPDGKFFSHRILSRDECFNATSKTDNLKALFPNGDSMVCIIDDREDVWNMASNLIQVKPYHFFQHTGDINAPPGLSKTELDGEGVDFKDLDEDNEAKEVSKNETTDTDNNQNENAAEDEKEKPIETSVDTKENTETPEESVNENNIKKDDEEDNTNNTVQPTENDLNKSEEKIEEENEADDKPSTSVASPKIKMNTEANKQIEIEDPDDYLLYLETILKHIHSRFYSIYDETNDIPDLKIIVPKIRSEVLRGFNLVFSGLVPTNMKLEQSRAYFIAKSLGANVSQNIDPDSTHLVAVTSGTYKVNAAKKNPEIKIVNANWLWCCSERWEKVDERLYPLDRKTKSKQRQPPAHCHSPEHVVNYSEKSEISTSSNAQLYATFHEEKFVNTINPLLSFSNADLVEMNNEFAQFFESDSSSEDEHINFENPPVDKSLLKRKREESVQDRARSFFTRTAEELMIDSTTVDTTKEGSSEEEDDDDETPGAKFRRGEDLPSDIDIGSDSNQSNDEDDGSWHMIGAALEREFLGLDN
ncbi:RNA polymerase II subunit A C-terminal domain phosphatase-like [Teleopsis dalmanni]|uniref:RNA polymerase II subunit A C-terminal domain phosphatase-like n=1 Tax=Teleopsis dalmanni TaxID=139649 RepID=UPI0018CF4AA6|nr:RNA polymerase II subunit A C-terminal domain phosphatase-like [Teleopsis dalmanni]